MVYLLILLMIIIVLLGGYLIRSHYEINHLIQQLDTIATGSHIHFTSQIHTQEFHEVYLRLNKLLAIYQQREYKTEQAEQQLKMTIQNMAHDLRTPLTSSIGYMQMMKKSQDIEKNQRYLEISLAKMAELKNMLEELFLYTKLTSEHYELESEPLSIYPLLMNSLFHYYEFFESHHTEPQMIFEDQNIQLFVNQEAIERVFQNIINNALIHGEGDFKVYQKGHTLCFYNTMNKDHIPDIEHIFERFYKADVARHKTSSGLGLAIVKEFVEKMGGTVQARIEDNQFVIELNLN